MTVTEEIEDLRKRINLISALLKKPMENSEQRSFWADERRELRKELNRLEATQ